MSLLSLNDGPEAADDDTGQSVDSEVQQSTPVQKQKQKRKQKRKPLQHTRFCVPNSYFNTDEYPLGEGDFAFMYREEVC